MTDRDQDARARELLKAASLVRATFSRTAVEEAIGLKDSLAMQVLIQLTLADGLTRKELAEKLAASQPNVSKSVAALIDAGFVATAGIKRQGSAEALSTTQHGHANVLAFLASNARVAA